MTTKETPSITIGKLDAARRQLETAIDLWFNGGDPVSIHTLVFAAYEIIHTISKKRDPNRRDLVFDSALIKDEHRAEYANWVKRHANFFKHGDREGDAVIEFKPLLSELFFLFSIVGLQACGERLNANETAYLWWMYIHKPHLLTESGAEMIAKGLTVDQLNDIRQIKKGDFLEGFRLARTKFGN